MEQDIDYNKKYSNGWSSCCGTCNKKGGTLNWGVFFLVFGGYFLLQELGYISTSVSIWPVLLFALGAYLIIKNLIKK